MKFWLKNSLIAAEYHNSTEITTDKQTASVVTLHICAFMFFWMYVMIKYKVSVPGVDITLICCEVNHWNYWLPLDPKPVTITAFK